MERDRLRVIKGEDQGVSGEQLMMDAIWEAMVIVRRWLPLVPPDDPWRERLAAFADGRAA